MPAGFTLSLYPWVYTSKFTGDVSGANASSGAPVSADRSEKFGASGGSAGSDSASGVPESAWTEEYSQKAEGAVNSFPELPLVNYSSQYGLSCFEGLKAFPQKDGSLRLFRPNMNAERFRLSMGGIKMPGFPEKRFLSAIRGVVQRNSDAGFSVSYNADWERDNFLSAESLYIRPFAWAEAGIGINLSYFPSIVVVTTPVGSYFNPDQRNRAVVTNRIRATDNGTGWIKCAANYTIPILAKREAIEAGYMEAIFLDYKENRYVEEGSSCNIFFLLKSGRLVTPELEGRILSGITRRSIITLAQDMGIQVEERRISIEEAMSETKECFVTGTAAGLTYIESITRPKQSTAETAEFNNGNMGELTQTLLHRLKGIQYGAVEDTFGWMFPV